MIWRISTEIIIRSKRPTDVAHAARDGLVKEKVVDRDYEHLKNKERSAERGGYL